MSLAQFSDLYPGDILTDGAIEYIIVDDATFKEARNKEVKWNYIAMYTTIGVVCLIL